MLLLNLAIHLKYLCLRVLSFQSVLTVCLFHPVWVEIYMQLEGPKSNQSIIETKLLCLVISMYVVNVNYCV